MSLVITFGSGVAYGETELRFGDRGAAGVGVPTGGTTGQVLGKVSDTDYDTAWVDQTGGGGGGSLTVREVDGTPTGTATVLQVPNGSLTFPSTNTARLTLTAAVVGADATGTAAAAVASHVAAADPHTQYLLKTGGTMTGGLTVSTGDLTTTGALVANGGVFTNGADIDTGDGDLIVGGGTVTAGLFSGNHSGDGSAVTDLNASALASGTVPSARLPVASALAVGGIRIGSGLAIDGSGVVSVTSGGTGTVTSVGLSLPSIFSVSGSPVTGAGTLTGTLASQTANTVFAAPNGTAGTPTFRALVAADIPTLNQNTTGNAATATALQTARNINGVAFNGSADITVTAAAGTLTGSTLASGVTASSLTSVGTLTGGATGAGFTVALGTSTLTGTVPVANGGTGASTAVGARANLGFVSLTTTATTGTVTLDLSADNITFVLSLTNNVTLALSNEADGRRFTLFVRGQASGFTITWFSGIKWSGGAAPTIPTTSGRVLPIVFVRLAAGEWLGIPGTECY